MGDERVERQDEAQGAGAEDETSARPESETGTGGTGTEGDAGTSVAPGSGASGGESATRRDGGADAGTDSDAGAQSDTGAEPDTRDARSSAGSGPGADAGRQVADVSEVSVDASETSPPDLPEFGPIPELDLDEEPVTLRQRLSSIVPRVGAMVAFGCAGFLGITSFVTAQGTDLRAERQSDLGDLVQAQAQRVNELSQKVAELDKEVAELSQQVGGVEVERYEEATERLKPHVGLTPVRGPGLTVTLDDAPREMRDGQLNLDALVVHQQDIQAVVNALWAGGAEAVTIQGQRLISTSAIRCVGNSVVLHRVPYPPPYRISAVGDVESMEDALYASDEVRAYLDAVDRFRLGFELRRHPEIRLPGYQGSFELTHARVIGAGAQTRTFGDEEGD